MNKQTFLSFSLTRQLVLRFIETWKRVVFINVYYILYYTFVICLFIFFQFTIRHKNSLQFSKVSMNSRTWFSSIPFIIQQSQLNWVYVFQLLSIVIVEADIVSLTKILIHVRISLFRNEANPPWNNKVYLQNPSASSSIVSLLVLLQRAMVR